MDSGYGSKDSEAVEKKVDWRSIKKLGSIVILRSTWDFSLSREPT